MHADQDDTPYRPRARRRHGMLLALTVLGSAATAAIGIPQWLVTRTPPASPTFAPAAPPPASPATPPRVSVAPAGMPASPAAPPPPRIHAYRPAQPEDASTPRQTEFNEHNYQPRPIVNRLPAVRASTSERPRQRQQSVTRSAKWSWKTRDGSVRGTFKWRESGGRIDYASVCMNERRGSLRYRDCRKGAKAAFARLCRERRDPAACHAENNYSALR